MENIASGSYSPRFSGSYSPKDFRELLSKREISGSYYLNKENIASGSYSPRFSGSYSPKIFRELLPEHEKYPFRELLP